MLAFQNAAVAAAEAAWVAERVHEVGDVPGKPATPYMALAVSSGAGSTYSLLSARGSQAYRLVAQVVGRTAGEVAIGVEKADGAFLDRPLVVAGYDTTPMRSEVASPIIRDPDAGVLLSVTLTYTFHAYPTEAA